MADHDQDRADLIHRFAAALAIEIAESEPAKSPYLREVRRRYGKNRVQHDLPIILRALARAGLCLGETL